MARPDVGVRSLNSAYLRFARWSRREVWQQVFAQLAGDADFEAVSIDSTIVRTHQHAAGAAKKTVTKRKRLQRAFDQHRYKSRNLIARFFSRIKQFRRVATRYDELAQRFSSFVARAASVIWLA